MAELMVGAKAQYFTWTTFIVTQCASVTRAKEEMRKWTFLVEGIWQSMGDGCYSSEKMTEHRWFKAFRIFSVKTSLKCQTQVKVQYKHTCNTATHKSLFKRGINAPILLSIPVNSKQPSSKSFILPSDEKHNEAASNKAEAETTFSPCIYLRWAVWQDHHLICLNLANCPNMEWRVTLWKQK